MNLSFSTNAFIRHSLIEAVTKIADIGYRGVEILADAPHLFAVSVKDSEIRRLKKAASEASIEIVNLNANTARGFNQGNMADPLFEPTLADPDEEARRWRVSYTKKCMDLAHQLGAPSVSISSGPIKPGSTPEESMDLFKASLGAIIPYAEQRGVNIGIEYEPGFLVEYAAELSSLLDEMGSKRLGANLDLGHSFVLGEEIGDVLNSLCGRIFHVHIEDIKDRFHHHLIPGEGEIDFARTLALFERNAYKGYFTVELYTYPEMPVKAARRAYDYINSISERA